MIEIKFNNIDFHYDRSNDIFRGLRFNVVGGDNNGHVMALMGGSGAGKTTLLKLLVGLLKPQKGKIMIKPDDLVFSYVPQESVLFEHLTPLQNAKYFQNVSKNKSRFDSNLFDHLVSVLEMEEVLKSENKINELSGGQKQRLSLLRALSIKPEVLLLDEPCTGLDADVKFAFLSKLHELTSELNVFTIYVTHHMDEAKFIGDSVAFLNKELNQSTIKRISLQSIRDFIANPPTLEALRITKFPELNILGVAKEDNLLKLSQSPDLFIAVNKHHFITEETEHEIEFKKQFSTDIYTSYKHEPTGNTIVLNSSFPTSEINLKISIKGTFGKYDLSGMYQGTEKNVVTYD